VTRSALILSTVVLALGAPLTALAQDTTTPPPSTSPPGTPGDDTAPPAGVGDAASGDDDDDEQQAQQQQTGATGATAADGESGTALQADMNAAQADETAETTPVPPVSTDTPADEEEKLPFRGSIFFWDQSYNLYGATLPYANPTYAWWFSFRPRWYFNDHDYVAGRFDLYYELTDSDSTTTNRELTLGDTILSYGHSALVEYEGAKLRVGASLTLPTSITSRANGLVVATGVSAGVSRDFEHVLEGLSLDAALGYGHSWNSRNTLSRDTDAASPAGIAGGAPEERLCNIAQVAGQGANAQTIEGDCAGGSSNVEHSITFGLTATLTPIKRMSVELGYTWWWRRARGLADATVPVTTATGPVATLADASETHWRNLQVFSVSVGYDVQDWLNLSLSWGTLTTQLSPNGTFRNPLWGPDSAIDLNATLALDELYKLFRPTPTTSQERNSTATASRRPARARE